MVIKNKVKQKLGGKNVWKLVRPGILTLVVNICCLFKTFIQLIIEKIAKTIEASEKIWTH